MKHTTYSGMLRRIACTQLPTKWGVFETIGFQRETSNGARRFESAVVLILGEIRRFAPLVRIHSQCFTGDVLGSQRCDCGSQLDLAMGDIACEGRGILIYEQQEGRGIGLMAKLQAYGLQDEGLDTVEANRALGFAPDYRDFALPVAILRDLGISRVRLLSNNPNKVRALIDAGIEVVEQVSCEVEPNSYSLEYLRTKQQRLGHMLSLVDLQGIGCAKAEGTVAEGEKMRPHRSQQPVLATVEAAIRRFREGGMIVVVDDEGRENEGDLTMAAEMITPEAINFMAAHGRGLICVATAGERLDDLKLSPMVPDNTALCGTAFTVSIDLKGRGITTGISASDRAKTIRALVDPRNHADDFARPGHVFPLRSRPGGVLERRGHTEAAVDLARLAGMYPAGVICEILNEDGTMARLPDLFRFCKRHNIVLVTVGDLEQYRLKCDYGEKTRTECEAESGLRSLLSADVGGDAVPVRHTT